MKCYKCNVTINSNTHTCPLCKNELKKEGETFDVFPVIPTVHKGHGIFLKILALIFCASTIVCVAINLLVSKKLSWSLVVFGANVCIALSLGVAIKKRHNFARLIFSEYMFIVIASILWDYFTGWKIWSLDFVLPLVSALFIYISFILRIFFPYQLRNYFLNIIFACAVGIVPIFLLIFDVTRIAWPTYISVITSLIMLSILVVFDGKKIKKEFESRMYV